MVRPGQVHNFGECEAWDGWILLVRPDFLWPASSRENLRSGFDIERFPAGVRIDAKGLERAEYAIQWLRHDAARNDESRSEHARHDLGKSEEFIAHMQSHLRYGFYALVSWIAITYRDKDLDDLRRRPALIRFHRFKGLVEQHFVDWRSITTYASEMGCTERSLTRSLFQLPVGPGRRSAIVGHYQVSLTPIMNNIYPAARVLIFFSRRHCI